MQHLTIAAVLVVGLLGCETYRDTYPDSTIEPARPGVVQPASPRSSNLIEGQVVRIESDSYVIRELSGRETRVFYDRTTMLDNVTVGDNVVVQFNGMPPKAYATSITRRTASAIPPAVTVPPAVIVPPVVDPLPRPRTIEGTVHHQYGNEYEIKDLSGKEVRLLVDGRTTRDSNITVGDRIVATASPLPTAYSVYRVGNPNIIQGEVIRIDDEQYIVRDINGRDIRIRVDDLNRYNSVIRVGDRVLVVTRRAPSDPPYYVYRFGDPGVIQGEVVRMDGNCYVVRDMSGRDQCLYKDSPTVWYDPVVVGDRVIAYTRSPSTLHADFIAKR
jgi:uncharacterized protein YdeI (BOF family)